MSTLVIKNLPENLHEKLRAQAARNHRSVTKEVVTLIESSVALQWPEGDRPPPTVKNSPRIVDDFEAAIIDGRYVSFKSQSELDAWMDELRADRDDVPR